MKVFISVGSARNQAQGRACKAILAALEAAGFEPREMSTGEWSETRRLGAVADIMSECAGVVVIATRRYVFESGIEEARAGSRLSGISQPTIWNQIEGALAVGKGLPVFVIAEEGLRVEGLLEDGDVDWTVHWAPLSSAAFSTHELLDELHSWKSRMTSAATEHTAYSSA